jgi:transcriptional regulator with XRE-family HTH domain
MEVNMRRRNVIGRMVSRLRFERNWTQDTLAARLQCEGMDITRDVVANIEIGRTKVTDDSLLFFQRAFRVQIVLLFSAEIQTLDEKFARRAAAKSLKTRSHNAKG